MQPGEQRDVRARNVNTVDEVPDSSWFTNRIGRRTMPIDELVRGPDSLPSVISLDGWVVSGGKSHRRAARLPDDGSRADSSIRSRSIRRRNPEMATGAEIIGTAFYYAFGYHTVEVYLAELDPRDARDRDTARRFSIR